MGLIRAFTGSVASYINDMWEDYIYCDSMDADTLVQKGHARRNGGAGDSAGDNVITEGSRIAVNAGQMLIVVENGQIVDFTAEQGGYEYRRDTSPSMFCGKFGDALKVSFWHMKERFAFGGQAANDQRVYFVNTKEILNNRFGFGNVPYRDREFDMTVLLQGYGTYSYEITDPIVFYTNVCGNVTEKYEKKSMDLQLKAEIQNGMLPVLGKLAGLGIHFDQLPMHTGELVEFLRENLCELWKQNRGIEMKSMAFSNILPDDESVDKIRQLQESRAYSGNQAMLGARVGAAQANAMESAAENSAGAVTGFMGMGMAQSAGGVNVAELMRNASARQESDAQPSGDQWKCSCGMINTMQFCPKCGAAKPKKTVCKSCGYEIPAEISGLSFCPNCGQKNEPKSD